MVGSRTNSNFEPKIAAFIDFPLPKRKNAQRMKDLGLQEQ